MEYEWKLALSALGIICKSSRNKKLRMSRVIFFHYIFFVHFPTAYIHCTQISTFLLTFTSFRTKESKIQRLRQFLYHLRSGYATKYSGRIVKKTSNSRVLAKMPSKSSCRKDSSSYKDRACNIIKGGYL